MKQKELKYCSESQGHAETDVHGRLGVPQPVGVDLAVSSCRCGLWSALQTAHGAKCAHCHVMRLLRRRRISQLLFVQYLWALPMD